jgi:hypothetical protein
MVSYVMVQTAFSNTHDMLKILCVQVKEVIVYHSGSPRVFNPKAVEYWNVLFDPLHGFRVVDNEDPVPSLPPPIIPYIPL